MAPARPLNIAHRGARLEAPENTLAAFRAAVDAGADALELDVHLTADECLAVIHDDSVRRTTGARGLVAAMTLAQLKALDAGRWFGKAFAGERIPELAEVVAAASGRAGLFVEVKNPGDRAAVVAAEVARRTKGFRGYLVIESFDAAFVKLYKEMNPGARVALLTESPRGLAQAAKAGADAVSVALRWPALVSLCEVKKSGLDLYVWTVKSFRALAHALEWDVHGIITDYPRETRAVLERLDQAARRQFGARPPEGDEYLQWRRRIMRQMKRWPMQVKKRGRGARA